MEACAWHRAPDPDEPNGEPSEDYSESHDFGDVGGYRESDDFPPAAPPETGGFPGPRYADHPADDYPGEFPIDAGYFDYTNPPDQDVHREEEPRPRRRWSTAPEVHPHEAFVGLAALLHGATTQELQHLTDADIDHDSQRIRLGRRPHPTPLDPWTWTALQRCINYRDALDSNNSHLLITMQTKATRAAASDSYVKNTLRAIGIQPRILRSTRLVDLVSTVDAKLVAAAYGMRNEAVTPCLADHVDVARQPNP